MSTQQLIRNTLIPIQVLALVLTLCVAEPAAASNAEGRIYGTVEMRSGSTYTGFLRWGSQEAYWDDLFHSAKEELPHLDEIDEEDRDERSERRIRILGYRINVSGGGISGSRVFIARFGDIASIEVTGDNEAEVTMKSGEVYEVSGYSDDVGGEIHVDDDSAGSVELKWKRIDRIVFEAAPRSAKTDDFRLYGTVETDLGEFVGYVQWDKEECMSSDELDGDSEDGDISIPMGNIASIERRGRRSSIVTLKDGREMRLRGSNDVDNDNRGIYVEDERYGRVLIQWSEFDKVNFEENGESGRGYDDYEASGALTGVVIDEDDNEYRGRIVYDADESEGWEMLNGGMADLEFDIPFMNIESISPAGRDACTVVLRNGEELELEDSQDVSEANDGILVYEDGQRRPTYIPWRELESIRFDR